MDVEQVAASLTEAQRELIACSWAGFHSIPIEIQALNGMELMHIDVMKGCDWLRWKARRTEFGDAVAAHLRTKEAQHG